MGKIDRRYSVAEGLAIKAPVRCATTANITLGGLQTIDGVTVVEHDRVLVKNQTNAVLNGIYEASTGNWQRTKDFDGAFDVVHGTQVFVSSGNSNSAQIFYVSTSDPITIGTSEINFLGRAVFDTNYNIYDVTGFGAIGDNSHDNTSLFASLAGLVPDGSTLYFPTGTYKGNSSSALITITGKRLRLIGDGVTSLIRNVGTGACVFLDGVDNVTPMMIDQLALATEAGGGDALKLRNCGRFPIGKIYIPSAGAYGIHMQGSHYITFNAPNFGVNIPYTAGTQCKPDAGIVFEDYNNGVLGNIPSSHNTVWNADISGLNRVGSTGTGIVMEGNASHNVVIGGNCASNLIGVNLNTNVELNTFIGLVVEGNTTTDFNVFGNMNTFINCQAFSFSADGTGMTFASGAYQNTVYGGRQRVIKVNTGADTTLLHGVAFQNLIDNGTNTQTIACYDLVNSAPFTWKMTAPSVSYASTDGMQSWCDNAQPLKKLYLGFDNTTGSFGTAWLQAKFQGSGFLPLRLNPGGGSIEFGGATVHSIQTLTWAGTPDPVTPNGALYDGIIITVTNAAGFGLAPPSTDGGQLTQVGQLFEITIKNATGGVMGTVSFDSHYKMAAWTKPANGFSRSITFRYDGTNWIEKNRTTADVPN
ncbi:hypothetical protein [Bradyrhizobium sp. BR 10289]|uniref:hypothetical protein n=1 Tax=Bradyrhizobium sp. BR 10289 TaxID=2749993 RepID=UPI001C64EF0B|nr:hypothetical protein [Bradyrhizobium sp. BR 10289]MBW7968606.1 hypothetical protein [Bradyrhizobium sp. BR 10289]